VHETGFPAIANLIDFRDFARQAAEKASIWQQGQTYRNGPLEEAPSTIDSTALIQPPMSQNSS